MRLADVCRDFDLELVVLYGSGATGRARSGSDSDLGVMRRKGLVPADRFLDLLAGLEEATGLPDIASWTCGARRRC